MSPEETNSPAAQAAGLNNARTAHLLLAAIVLFHVVANLLWLRYDNHVIRIDEEFHATGARDYYYALVGPEFEGIGERLQAIGSIKSPYPPLLHILGALLALLLGYSRDIVVLAGTLSFVLTLLGVYRLSRLLFDRAGALLATTIAGFIPILFAGSRYMALENLIAALTVWAIYALYRSKGFQLVRWSALFGLLNGAAILTKPNAFAYYLPASAFVFLFGLVLILRARDDRGAKAGRLLSNSLFSVALAVLVFLPWYAWHRDYLQDYWLNEHKGGSTPFSFVEKASEKDAVTATSKPEAKFVPQPKSILDSSLSTTPPVEKHATMPAPAAAEASAPSRLTVSLRSLLDRGWLSYPINIINNGAFLPLALIGFAGLPFLLRRREDRGAALMVLVWFFGAYFLMTLAFRHTTPRYTMPFIAPLGIGATALLLAIPSSRMRHVVTVIVLAGLGWQYLFISTGAPLLPSKTHVPVLTEHDQVTRYLDSGLVIQKNEVVVGTYCFAPPRRGPNYVERNFRKMLEVERTKGRTDGDTVPYLALWRQNNFGGYLFEGPSWWPAPNPLLRSELENDTDAKYRFTQAAAVMSPEEAAPLLDDVEYAVVILADTEITRADQFYHSFYTKLRGRAPLMLHDYFSVDAYGKLPGALVGLLGRKDVVPVTESKSLFDLADDFDISTWMGESAEEVHRDRREVFDANTRLTVVNDEIGFALVQIRRVSELMVQYRALFKCQAPIERDWRVCFEASKIVNGEAQRTFNNIAPIVPTSQWDSGNYYIVDRYCLLPPAEYYTRIYFFENDAGTFGNIIDPGPAQQL